MQNVTPNDDEWSLPVSTTRTLNEVRRAVLATLNSTEFRPPARFTSDELDGQDYHEKAPGISKSHLDVMNDGSARHYWQAYLNPERSIGVEPTDALRLGNAIHAAVLEPHLLEKRYAEWCGADRRTKEGKALYLEFERTRAGRTKLTQIEMETCRQIRQAFGRHPLAKGLLMNGKAEQSFFARHAETGALVKCRTDYISDDGDTVVDIKTTTDANPIAFGKDAANYRYDVAVPWYFDIIAAVQGHMPKRWIWLVIEKSEPYAIAIYYAQKKDIVRARDTARRNLLEILHYRERNEYPDYGDKIRPLELASWAKR